MKQNYASYHVGEVFNEHMRPWEGAMYSFQDGAHTILLSFDRIQRHEQRAIESGLWRFGLYVEDEVIFLLFKADAPHQRPGILWQDMPYSYHKVEAEARSLPIAPSMIPDPLGVLILVFLLDARSQRIVALNAKNTSHDFARHLHEAIIQQAGLPYDHTGFHSHVDAIRRRYPTPEALAGAAQAKCIGGIYEAG